MELALWLWNEGKTGVDFAREINVPYSTMSSWIRGSRKPGLENALKISRATKGKVSVHELMNGIYVANRNGQRRRTPQDVKNWVATKGKRYL